MIQLLEGGAYLVDGKQVIAADQRSAGQDCRRRAGVSPSPEEAKKNTMAYEFWRHTILPETWMSFRSNLTS